MTEADVDKLRALPNWPQRLTIVPTIPREMRVANALTFPADHLGKIKHRILLQLGSDSPPWFGTAIETLSKALPNATVEILPARSIRRWTRTRRCSSNRSARSSVMTDECGTPHR